VKIVSFLSTGCFVSILVLAAAFAAGWLAGRARGRREGRAQAISEQRPPDSA
jgi:lipopolysaccharide biosynthesis regulator YciM